MIVAQFLKSEMRVDAYNVSSADKVTVRRIAEIVLEECRRKWPDKNDRRSRRRPWLVGRREIHAAFKSEASESGMERTVQQRSGGPTGDKRAD